MTGAPGAVREKPAPGGLFSMRGALLAVFLVVAANPADSALAQDAGALRLAPCPETPNCVSSGATDRAHWVAPLPAPDGPAALQRLKGALAENPRAEVVEEREGYLRAEFHIPVFGFVDDVEFLWSAPEKVLHVRSASRKGRWDLGVNRRRVERIRSALSAPARARRVP